MKKLSIIALCSAAVFGSANAVSFSFGAVVSSGIADAFDVEYNESLYAEVGTYESNVFQLIGGSASTVTDGLFAASVNGINTTATGMDIVGDQLAFKIYFTDTPTGDFALFSVDKTFNTDWAVVSGDGTAFDFGFQSLDVADLTNSGSGLVLDLVNATLINATLGSTDNSVTVGGNNFVLSAVPEPSSYAFLAGALGLACVVFRRK